MTSDVNGRIVSFVEYDQWGRPIRVDSLTLGNREIDLVTRFTGHRYDPVLGMYYARFRMYDPNIRRFISTDPVRGTVLDPQTMAQYTYVLNNPLRFVDPWGLLGTPAFIDDWGYAWYWTGSWTPEWALPTPEPPPSFNSILEEVWEWIESMTDDELMFAISTGLFEAMGVYIPSGWLDGLGSDGHIDFNDLRQELTHFVADAIWEDSSGRGLDLLSGWAYVYGNGWPVPLAGSTDRAVTISEEALLASRVSTQSFILHDPNTHWFSISGHVNSISNALYGLYGGIITRISTTGWRAEDFEEWWNSLTGHIGAIVFVGHARYDRLQFDSSRNAAGGYNDAGRRERSGVPERDFGVNTSQVQNLITLNSITADMVVLMGCNPGQLQDNTNIAMELARHVDGVVFAPDGLFMMAPTWIGGMTYVRYENQYFVAHMHTSEMFQQRIYAVDASSWARTGTHITEMYEWVRANPTGSPPIDILPPHLQVNRFV